MHVGVSHYPQSIVQTMGISKTLLVSLHLVLLRVGLEANMLVVLGPSFVITRFVLGKSLSCLDWLATRLLVRSDERAC